MGRADMTLYAGVRFGLRGNSFIRQAATALGMVRLKGEINPKLPDHMIYRAHGVRLDLHMGNPEYEETAKLADEICKRVSVLRKSIEAAGLYMNEFENTWGYLAEVNIHLFDNLAQHNKLAKYWDKDAHDYKGNWTKEIDPLDAYYITVSFLSMRDEDDLPPGKLRSMIIWLHQWEHKAPLGNMAYVSKNFIF